MCSIMNSSKPFEMGLTRKVAFPRSGADNAAFSPAETSALFVAFWFSLPPYRNAYRGETISLGTDNSVLSIKTLIPSKSSPVAELILNLKLKSEIFSAGII
ncbi:MAG: hypothetical protein AB7V08_14655 [Elusimicrobiales bacterium]